MASSHAPSENIWFSVSLGLLGIIFGYSVAHMSGSTFVPRSADANTPPPTPSAASEPAVTAVPAVDVKTDHVRGNPNAQLSVITYSDFECPFSKRHHPTLAQILTTYGDKVNVVYRHFPLGFHQNAEKEAEASECVAELGGNTAFWKFADGIYAKTTSNGTGFVLDQLGPLAKSVGVDQAKFQQCLDSGKEAAKVKAQQDAGAAAGVNGTPGNFLVLHTGNQIRSVMGAQPFDTFKQQIDSLLKGS